MNPKPLSALIFALLMLLPAGAALADEFVVLERSPEIRDDPALLREVNLVFHLDTLDAKEFKDHDRIAIDGSDLMLYVKSDNVLPQFSVCARVDVFGPNDEKITNRHACWPWFDGQLHEVSVASGEESKATERLVVNLYTVAGPPLKWDGESNPANMMIHAVYTTEIVDEAKIAAEKKTAFNKAHIERSLLKSSKSILKCAHPTGKYQGVAINTFKTTREGFLVDFTIDYQCRLSKRACFMNLAATFDVGGVFQSLEVKEDSAKTNPEVGLKACKSLLKLAAP